MVKGGRLKIATVALLAASCASAPIQPVAESPVHSGLETKVRENMGCSARAVVTKLVESEKVAAALRR